MIAIYRRELQSYFTTAIGYVFMGVFLLLTSAMFYAEILQTRSSDILTFIGEMSYLWMLLTPVLTMRLVAEERQRHTDQLLLTSPVSIPAIVAGKYLAAVTVMVLTVLLTFAYVAIVGVYGVLYPLELLCGYMGFLLQGCAFIAIDLFISALMPGQVTAAVAAFGLNLSLWMMDLLAASVPDWAANICTFLSLYSRNEPFLMGQLSFASIGYDITVALAFLAATVYAMDTSRSGRRAGT